MPLAGSVVRPFTNSWNAIGARGDEEARTRAAKVAIVGFNVLVSENIPLQAEIQRVFQSVSDNEIDSALKKYSMSLNNTHSLDPTEFTNTMNCVALIQSIDAWLSHADVSFQGLDIFAEETYSGGSFLPANEVQFCGNKYFLFRRNVPFDKTVSGFVQFYPNYFCTPNHRIIPKMFKGINISVHRLPRNFGAYHETNTMFESKIELCVYIGAYHEPRDLEKMIERKVVSESGSNRYYYFSLEGGLDPEKRKQALYDHLKTASQQKAHVVLLPELTVSPSMLRELQIKLGRRKDIANQLLILPGTYHVSDGRRVNRAEIITGQGRRICIQDKAQRYSAVDKNRDEHIEDIIGANTINLIEIGGCLIGVPICIDFFNELGEAIWRYIDVSIQIVPSMGDRKTERGHISRLDQLAKTSKTSAIVAQESYEERSPPMWVGAYDGKGKTFWNGEGEPYAPMSAMVVKSSGSQPWIKHSIRPR